MKRYLITYDDKIREIEVEKETDKCYYTKERYDCVNGNASRFFKNDNYHETWEAAYNELIRRYESKADYLRKELERVKGKIGQIRGMKKP